LTLIFTTRNDGKGNTTLVALKRYISKHRLVRPRLPLSKPQILLRPENLELTSLQSVRELSERLRRSAIPKLDAIILNAGVGGQLSIDWPRAIWSMTTDFVQSLTWPRYKISAKGLLAPPQLPSSTIARPYDEEPVLGQLFCANLFGHYVLAHRFMPLLRACPASRPGRVIWLSSLEGEMHDFDKNDFQGLESSNAYEQTKRMTTLMALTSTNLPATARSVQSFYSLSDEPGDRRLATAINSPTKPQIHAAHPGICVTSIVPLPWILQLLTILSFYIARLIGSPWHTVSPYVGAAAPVWLALAGTEEIADRERSGPALWGSAVTRSGGRGVPQRTDVPGWGLCGDGRKFEWWQGGAGWLGGWGRKRGVVDASVEDVERFIEDGAVVWRELERLRIGWEERMDRAEGGLK
jgi:3-keto steroid reductase